MFTARWGRQTPGQPVDQGGVRAKPGQQDSAGNGSAQSLEKAGPEKKVLHLVDMIKTCPTCMDKECHRCFVNHGAVSQGNQMDREELDDWLNSQATCVCNRMWGHAYVRTLHS